MGGVRRISKRTLVMPRQSHLRCHRVVRPRAVDAAFACGEEGEVGGGLGPEQARDAIIQVDRGDVLVPVRPVAELDEVVPSYSMKEDSRMASNKTATQSSMLSARGVSMSSPLVSVHIWPYLLLPVK